MAPVLQEVLAANESYAASFGDKGKLAMPPARRFAILTCMDARLDPAKYAGLAEGDAHVIRNAGGRASDDAIRSLVISHKLLDTQEWFVVHHSDCGMQLFTGEIIGNLLEDNLETAQFDGKTWSNPKHAAAPSPVTTSTGTPSMTTPKASPRMSSEFAVIPWCRNTSRFTASSMTSRPASSTRSPRRARRAEHQPECSAMPFGTQSTIQEPRFAGTPRNQQGANRAGI